VRFGVGHRRGFAGCLRSSGRAVPEEVGMCRAVVAAGAPAACEIYLKVQQACFFLKYNLIISIRLEAEENRAAALLLPKTRDWCVPRKWHKPVIKRAKIPIAALTPPHCSPHPKSRVGRTGLAPQRSGGGWGWRQQAVGAPGGPWGWGPSRRPSPSAGTQG